MTVDAQRLDDDYEIAEVLGRGAMGTVYAGKDTRTGRQVAIKSLDMRGGFGPDDPELQRFEQEARIAGSLASTNIAQVFDIRREPDTDKPFLVMEYLMGEDLEATIARVGPLPVDVALRIAEQACAGLEAAHAAGVVHRDIKPANLFLSRADDGRIVVKILDFGIAKIRRLPPDVAANGIRDGLTAPQVSLTATGQILGSPLFMSPEQVDGMTTVDARADVYSLGLTIYTMLAGAPPHRNTKSFVELLYLIQNVPPRPIREVAPWVPAQVESILIRATRLERDERFASIAALHEAIRALQPADFTLREEQITRATGSATEKIVMDRHSDPHAATLVAPVPEMSGRARGSNGTRRVLVIAIGMAIVLALVAMAVWRGNG